MKLVRYNPFNDLSLFRETFNDFFNDPMVTSRTNQIWNPPVDIVEQEDSVVLTAELPGVSKENISIDIQENVLTVKGERKQENEEKGKTYYRRERNFGKFQRAFTLSDDIITDNINAQFKEGILTLTLKKGKREQAVKRIPIQ